MKYHHAAFPNNLIITNTIYAYHTWNNVYFLCRISPVSIKLPNVWGLLFRGLLNWITNFCLPVGSAEDFVYDVSWGCKKWTFYKSSFCDVHISSLSPTYTFIYRTYCKHFHFEFIYFCMLEKIFSLNLTNDF